MPIPTGTGKRIARPKHKPTPLNATSVDADYADILKDLGMGSEYSNGTPNVAAPQKPKPPVVINKITFRETAASKKLWADLDAGHPVGAVGPAATGKTLAVTAYAQSRNLTLYVLQGTEELDKCDLRGTVSLKDGATVFIHSPVAKSLLDKNPHGALLLFDELNGTRPGVQIALNNLVQRDVNARLVIPETGEVLTPNDKWRFAATWNSGYTGTRPINEALISRLAVTEFDTMPNDLEHAIISDRYPTLLKLVSDVVSVAGFVREARKAGNFEFDMCLRTSFQLIENWNRLGGTYDKLVMAVRQTVLPKIGDATIFREQREGLLASVGQLAKRHGASAPSGADD